MLDRSRRSFLRAGAAFTAAVAASRARPALAQGRAPGGPVTPYGSRSRYESNATRFSYPSPMRQRSASLTPLRELHGILTPSSLHFEVHHSGVPDLDPASHSLTIHGLVDRPLVFTVDELKRLPSVSRILFIECGGNSSSEWRGASDPDVQSTHGLTSCSEWTGVPLSTLLGECGVGRNATWILAEGADACRMARSLPMDKALDDVLVAFAQNGEPLRPEQGYPLRLLAPGWEGNVSVKWLHRIEAIDGPAMTRWETAKYTDLLPDGRARQFTFEMEAKSVITRPSGGDRLPGPGVYEITGLAWSGRREITRVHVTTDAGKKWIEAELQTPVLSRAHTRFRLSWKWDGRKTLLASRCEDATGFLQPYRADLVKARGLNSGYHYNAVQVWMVAADGQVTNATA
jgi:sulfane dehydrogenase subunit SoxC